MRFRIPGAGFGIPGVGFVWYFGIPGVPDLEFLVRDLEFLGSDLWLGILEFLGFRTPGAGFGIPGAGFGIPGAGCGGILKFMVGARSVAFG